MVNGVSQVQVQGGGRVKRPVGRCQLIPRSRTRRKIGINEIDQAPDAKWNANLPDRSR